MAKKTAKEKKKEIKEKRKEAEQVARWPSPCVERISGSSAMDAIAREGKVPEGAVFKHPLVKPVP